MMPYILMMLIHFVSVLLHSSLEEKTTLTLCFLGGVQSVLVIIKLLHQQQMKLNLS